MALDAPLAEAHREVAPAEGTIAMRYTSRENYDPSAPRDKIATMLAQAFTDTAETEGYQGHTLVGPHRDDATFLVGGNNLAATASRGQQRSLLLALLFAEITLLTDRAGRPPVLLLDDAFSELDPNRRDRLVERLKHLPQTLITATSPDDLAPNLVAAATAIEIINTDEGSEAKR
jgi:DNA replication and repair protein RecF